MMLKTFLQNKIQNKLFVYSKKLIFKTRVLSKISRINKLYKQKEYTLIKSIYTENWQKCSLLVADINNLNFYFSDSYFKKATPLHLAAALKNERLVQILLDNGADITVTDAEGNTALFYSCREGDTNTASLLLAYGADINILNQKGENPLYAAVMEVPLFGSMIEKQVSSDIISFLISEGADAGINNLDEFIRAVEQY